MIASDYCEVHTDRVPVTSDTYVFGGKTMVPGTEFAVAGERGARFRFLGYVHNGEVAWINCIGGPKGVVMWRSFRPDRILRITRLTPLASRPAR